MTNPQWPHRVASDTFYSLEQSRNSFRSRLMRKTLPLNEDHQDSGSVCVLEKDALVIAIYHTTLMPENSCPYLKQIQA